MWKYENNELDPSSLLKCESLFALGNGNLGARGVFEEGYGEGMPSIRGTYLNGFYDELPIEYQEAAYGFPKVLQKTPNLMDAQSLHIKLDGERVSLFCNRHANYNRILHFDLGMLTRSFDYMTKAGKQATISIKKMVAQEQEGLILWKIDVSYNGVIQVVSSLSLRPQIFSDSDDPRVASKSHRLLSLKAFGQTDQQDWCLAETERTAVSVCARIAHVFDHDVLAQSEETSEALTRSFESTGKLCMTKFAVYETGMDSSEVLKTAEKSLGRAVKKSFEDYAREQRAFFDAFWNMADIRIWGDEETQLAIRLHLFQLVQSTGRKITQNISAKGLSGEGYEGHYFWDTEIYVLPLFQLLAPDTARNLLLNRYNMLGAARERAKELGHRSGVKFPWRTITGRECSSYFPAGTAQYHINGDIAYAFVQNYLHTLDEAFLIEYGLEVLMETSRLWLDIGHHNEGKFCIDAVTGPDEYTALVNNNYYTNAMAKFGMEWTVKLWRRMKEKYPEKIQVLEEKLALESEELDDMEKAAERMTLPHDEGRKLDLQDDHFLQKKVWDFEGTPKKNYPLLLHYHPLTIYRHQVLKQADTVLAHFLLEDYSDFDTMRNSFNYYEKITTHDSSLSSCVYGMMASRLGDVEKAYRYFIDSAMIDLHDTHRNTKDGLHMANLAGSALSVISGFAGFRSKSDGIHLQPRKPLEWEGYEFSFSYQKRKIQISVKEEVILRLLQGEPIEIWVDNETVLLSDCCIQPLKE